MATSIVSNATEVFSLEDHMLNPPDGTEWVDGQLIEKTGMTAHHGRIQARLARYWSILEMLWGLATGHNRDLSCA